MSDRVLVLSERPGTIIHELSVDIPDRGQPLARRQVPQVHGYAAQIFDLLKLNERAA